AQPVFDTQEKIYTDMVAALEEANTMYTADAVMDGNDLLYNNNKALWRKFNNSLLLRYYLRQSKRIDATAKIQAILDNPAQYPILTSNDNASMEKMTGLAPDDYSRSWRQD